MCYDLVTCSHLSPSSVSVLQNLSQEENWRYLLQSGITSFLLVAMLFEIFLRLFIEVGTIVQEAFVFSRLGN